MHNPDTSLRYRVRWAKNLTGVRGAEVDEMGRGLINQDHRPKMGGATYPHFWFRFT